MHSSVALPVFSLTAHLLSVGPVHPRTVHLSKFPGVVNAAVCQASRATAASAASAGVTCSGRAVVQPQQLVTAIDRHTSGRQQPVESL